MYEITITKTEPISDEEKAALKERDERDFRYNKGMDRPYDPGYYGPTVPAGHKISRVLNVTLTEVEFSAIKKAVIEVM